MTLTELSMFMKKQELELQLRTEKEKEEGECCNWHVDTSKKHWMKASDKPHRSLFISLGKLCRIICKEVGCVKNKQIEVDLHLHLLFCL